jgi:hypothetical protein
VTYCDICHRPAPANGGRDSFLDPILCLKCAGREAEAIDKLRHLWLGAGTMSQRPSVPSTDKEGHDA